MYNAEIAIEYRGHIRISSIITALKHSTLEILTVYATCTYLSALLVN